MARDLPLLIPFHVLPFQYDLTKLGPTCLPLRTFQDGNLAKRVESLPQRLGVEPHGEGDPLGAERDAKERRLHLLGEVDRQVFDRRQRMVADLVLEDILPLVVSEARVAVLWERPDEVVESLFPLRGCLP